MESYLVRGDSNFNSDENPQEMEHTRWPGQHCFALEPLSNRLNVADAFIAETNVESSPNLEVVAALGYDYQQTIAKRFDTSRRSSDLVLYPPVRRPSLTP